MSIKQYIYNKDPREEMSVKIAGCAMNISYIKMSDHYYSWEIYSSMSKYCILKDERRFTQNIYVISNKIIYLVETAYIVYGYEFKAKSSFAYEIFL